MDTTQFKLKAKEVIRGNYILWFIVFVGIFGASLIQNSDFTNHIIWQPFIAYLVTYAISFLGTFIVYSCIAHATKLGRDFKFSDFKDAVDWSLLWNYIWLNIIATIKIALWTLLFIIPGIIKAYEYAMIGYDFIENPGLETEEYFMRAKEMMTGHKFDLFMLNLSFFFWILLSVLTFGVVGIYVYPYIYVSQFFFYLGVSKKAEQSAFLIS